MLEWLPDDDLPAFVVWLPMVKGDDRAKAEAAVRRVPDRRARHFWDGGRRLGQRYAAVVALPGKCRLAWDVYFAFDAAARWGDGAPPAPAEWMHQLGAGRGDARWLDPDALRVSVVRLLEAVTGR